MEVDEHSGCVNVSVAGFEGLGDGFFLGISILPCAKTNSGCRSQSDASPMRCVYDAVLTDLSPSIKRKLCIESSHCSCLKSYLIGKLRKSESCDSLCASEHYGRENEGILWYLKCSCGVKIFIDTPRAMMQCRGDGRPALFGTVRSVGRPSVSLHVAPSHTFTT